MLHDQFIITHFDATTGHGLVRHTASADGSPLHQEPLAFSVQHVTEYYCTASDYGYRIPTREIVHRVPEIDTAIMGIIAHELDRTLSYGNYRLPFLRNWFYADQLTEAFVMARVNGVHSDASSDDEDELPPLDASYETVYGQQVYVHNR